MPSIFNFFQAWRKQRARFALALRFNRQHQYAGTTPVAGNWMCPTCNTPHPCYSWSPFTGRNFPACCANPLGHRNDRIHASGI